MEGNKIVLKISRQSLYNIRLSIGHPEVSGKQIKKCDESVA